MYPKLTDMWLDGEYSTYVNEWKGYRNGKFLLL
jgi:hypothetical protein